MKEEFDRWKWSLVRVEPSPRARPAEHVEGRLQALSVVLAPPPRSSPRRRTAGPGRAGDRGRGAAGRGEAVAERSTAVSALPQSVCKHWSALLAGLALAFPGSKNIPTEGRRKRNTNNHVGYSCSEESFGRGSRNEQRNGNTH